MTKSHAVLGANVVPLALGVVVAGGLVGGVVLGAVLAEVAAEAAVLGRRARDVGEVADRGVGAVGVLAVDRDEAAVEAVVLQCCMHPAAPDAGDDGVVDLALAEERGVLEAAVLAGEALGDDGDVEVGSGWGT